jgi:adenine C2-methylase RlmN of 23S rRNA A2503 and tRNA A37
MRGDLCSGEILEQLLHAMAIAPIRNIVFMGQGEVRYTQLYCVMHYYVNSKQSVL